MTTRLTRLTRWPGKTLGHVIFVHGLGGHAYDTWRCDEGDSAFWPLWLARDVKGLDVWTLSYAAPASNWLGNALALQDRAVNILEVLLAEAELAGKPVVFVCHSLGGLVVKQVLREANDQRDGRPQALALLDQTKAIVFFATPHTGSARANLLDWLRVIVWPSMAVRDLMKNDANLRNLNDWYRGWTKRREHLVFYETRPTPAGIIVDATSANPGLAGVRPIPLDADHFGVCKPADDESLAYIRTRSFLREDVFQIATGRDRSGEAVVLERPEVSASSPRMWVPALLRAAVLGGIVAAGIFLTSLNSVTVTAEDCGIAVGGDVKGSKVELDCK